MCGFVAVFSPERPIAPERLAAAQAALAARGPDGAGTLSRGPITLLHRRLAMTGGPGGAQPIELGPYALVTNGEVYGRAALTRRLRAPPRSGSDAALVLGLYAEYGVDALADLRGELALALWDGARQSLLCFRDRFGIRPLVYTRHEGALWVASRARAFRAAGIPLRLDEEAVHQTLSFQYLRPDQTLFSGVHALPPGGLLTADRDGVRVRSLVTPSFRDARDAPVGRVETASRVRALLADAVRERLDADQPLGFQLSGGVDSAAVVALAHAAGVARPRCFTVAFGPAPLEVDERPFVDQVVRATGAELEVIDVGPSEIVAHLGAAIEAAEGAAIDAHVVAKSLLAARARALGVTGLLTGEGADEVFAGYAHLAPPHGVPDPSTLGVHLPLGPEPPLDEVTARLGSAPTWWRAKAAFGLRAHAFTAPDWVSARTGAPLRDLAEQLIQTPGFPGPTAPALDVAQWTWTRVALGGYILPIVGDGPELSHGVEGRLPFLDHWLVDAVWSWPAALRRPTGPREARAPLEKGILRDALVGLLPESVRLRPKHPFMGPPLFSRSPLARSFLLDTLGGARAPYLAADVGARIEAALGHPDPAARRALEPVLFLLLSLVLLGERLCGPGGAS